MFLATAMAATIALTSMPTVESTGPELKVWAQEIVKQDVVKKTDALKVGLHAKMKETSKVKIATPVVGGKVAKLGYSGINARD